LENRISAGLSAARQGRKFGLTLGAAFAALTILFWWRGKHVTLEVTAALSALLIIAAIVLPAQLVAVERAWMRLAELMSAVTTPVILGIVYYVVFTPIGLVMRFAGRRPMRHADVNGSFWIARDPQTAQSDLRRLF
jgi:saxitoxin biosynthesis operon SxtJ-like protein